MASTDAVGAVASQGASASAAQVNSLGLDDFMKILLTQLTYQDPLKPMDNQEFISQLAQFTALQQTRESTQNLQQLLQVQSATQAISLLGKTVDVQGDNGSSSTGQVGTLRFSNGQPLITVTQSSGAVLADIPLSRISLVRM